jgi:hypothetical protein
MKTFFWISIACFLLPVPASVQALSDAPTPRASTPALPDARWSRIQQISDGQPIAVRTTSGNILHCRFAGATESVLFCDPPGPLQGQPGYRFDRTSVIGVREIQPPSDLHPGLIAAMAIAGTAIGIVASRNTTDTGAVAAGLITAGFVGAIGYPLVQMQSQNAGFGFTIPMR